ncbi:unnamed protein product [Cladocopium goreaui]|uniref:Epsin-1 n=1 Tax=Cladocopium goreaui TaxID=2562237 RepID=A0A9P1FV78_9DINO|nr:unnamed protein product [Cladocopium goreaui]
MELCDFNTWQMTESGTPYIKNVGNSYLDPRPTWGHYWPFRTTLVRRTNTTDSWTLVEMTQRFMDKDEPFGLIDECIFNMDGECEILTILGVEEHGFEEFGDLLDEDEEVDGPLRLPDSQPQEHQPAVPVEQRQDVSQGAVSSEAIQVREPPGLFLQDPLGGEEPAAALADVAFPEIESVELDDGLILTCESPVRDLRAGCRLLGISQAGSKGKMFERIKKSYVQGMRRAAIDMARAEYQREEHPAQPAHLAARQPTQRERIGVRFVSQLVLEVTIMQVMLTLILQQNEIDPQSKTRSIRRTALTWSADEILSLVIGPWDTTGYTQSKVKQKPVLALPPRPFFDEEAEAVKGLQDSDDEREQAQQEVQSNAYEPTTPDGEGPRLEDVTERDDGRVPVPSLPPLCAVPVDPGMEAPQTPEEMLMSGAGGASPSSPTMDVDSSGHAASKHKAETQGGRVAKALKFDSDPVPEPKVKAAKMDVRRVGEVDITHNDVIDLEDDWEFLPYEDLDSEDEGTEHVGVMLRKRETYEDVFDRWIEADEWSDVTREQRKDSQPSTSPTATSMADLRSGIVLGEVLMLMMGLLVMMVPGAASRSRSRDDPQPEYANVQQWTSEMRNFLATTFVLSAKAYWIDGQHDQFSIENMFNHLRLAALLMKNDKKEAVEHFITAVEVNDPEEIMAQVRNMRMCMDLPHVNLLHAEAWLWEEFRDDLQRKADASDGAFFVPIVELLKHRWDTPPGESDRGGDEDAVSSRSSIANRSGDENVRESPAREFELRMTMNLPRSEAIQVAQTIADAHGRELVVERPAGPDEREHGDRDGQEPEPGSSNNNTLGRSSENTTLNSRTTQNTTEEENDKIEQAMAEARASLRRGIRVLQSRATRYEELGDHEAAEEVRRQIDDMEAMESSI